MIQALLNPEIYPEKPPSIEMIQTQMSFILLAGDYVYKIKKPVNLGYLDYTSLDKRKFYCDKEVELNQRLCPDDYLGVVPISGNKQGFIIGGDSEAIEYAVKMRHLPADRMLDVLLSQNRVSHEVIGLIAKKMADFHNTAETSADISSFGKLDTIIQNTEENFSQTEKYFDIAISEDTYSRIMNYTRQFIKAKSNLFKKRVSENRMRDCHGDLHSAHICLTDKICIYDCIEFNDRFRYCDVASEIAFLAMDMDYHGHSELSRDFINSYVEESRDRKIPKLLDFYKCYRAYVRGKVNCFKLDDPHVSEKEKEITQATAKRYFELAESYI